MGEVAVVAGVGAERGLGAALCRRFALGGYHVVAAGRTQAKVDAVASAIVHSGGAATAFSGDMTVEADVLSLFARAAGLGTLAVVASNAGNNMRFAFRDTPAADFEAMWRVGCLSGFLIGREAARNMVPNERGTILFTGASASLRGRAGFAAFSAAKAGLRMVAQSMAREFGPLGVHVAHVVVDGAIDGERVRSRMPDRAAALGQDGMLDIDAIAEAFWHIHAQPRSAWTQEIDLRPYKEAF